MPKQRRPHLSSLVTNLARLPPGPLFSSALECRRCGAEWLAVYTHPSLTFPCHHCGGRALRQPDLSPHFSQSNFLDEPEVEH